MSPGRMISWCFASIPCTFVLKTLQSHEYYRNNGLLLVGEKLKCNPAEIKRFYRALLEQS